MIDKNTNTTMKKNYERMIQDVIKSINWNRIKYFHQVFGIKWQFEEKSGSIMERYPTIGELREELRSLLKFVINKDTKTLDYGNWIIFWKNEDDAKFEGLGGARLEAIFSLEECFVIDSDPGQDTVAVLENKLESAIKMEKYEEAAKIRDKIKEKKKS
jgi:hypothetical protein